MIRLADRAPVLENPGLNVVGNQEYAQAVWHVGVRCHWPTGEMMSYFPSPRSIIISSPPHNLAPKGTGASTRN